MKNQSYEFIKGFENKHTNIGFGSYGQVKLARNTETNQLVAIKLVFSKNAQEQIQVHSKLTHPNIVKLLNYYYDSVKNTTYMVLQYVDNGTLFDKIRSSLISKDKIRKIYKQVCQAVDFLHQNNLMHRDIKPENILINKNYDAKLCDFGFAALVGERKTLCGTYEYMAPQMIQNMPYDSKVDVWALGILFFQMIEGVAPFRGESPEQVLNEMKKSIYFSEKFQQQEITLIKSILRVNPSNRPTIAHILQNDYFKQPEFVKVGSPPHRRKISFTGILKPEFTFTPKANTKTNVKLFKPSSFQQNYTSPQHKQLIDKVKQMQSNIKYNINNQSIGRLKSPMSSKQQLTQDTYWKYNQSKNINN